MKTTVNFMKKNASLFMLATLLSCLFFEPSFAGAGGGGLGTWDTSDLVTFLGSVATGLKVVGASVITIAFIFAGYQIAFNGKSISAVVPVVIGGIVIGSAVTLAGIILPR